MPEGEFSVGDAQHPPPGPFDVVAAVQLLMHVPDPVAVLSAAAAPAPSWPRRCGAGSRSATSACSARRSPRGWGRARRTAAVTEPDRLRAIAGRAGLVVAHLDEVVCPFDYADDDELLGPLFESELGRMVGRRAGPGALRAAVLERLAPYRTRSGGYRLLNLFRLLVAHPGVRVQPVPAGCAYRVARKLLQSSPLASMPSRVSRARLRCSGT